MTIYTKNLNFEHQKCHNFCDESLAIIYYDSIYHIDTELNQQYFIFHSFSKIT
jgi:hypothetical protein